MLMGRKFPFLALLNRIEMFRKKELTSAEIEQKLNLYLRSAKENAY